MNYSGIAQTALRQIKDKGRKVAIVTRGVGEVYDPTTDTFSPGDDNTVDVMGAFTRFATRDIDGELILRTDMRVLIAASDIPQAPIQGDMLTDGGVTYSVINTETVKPGDTAILYMVQVRR